MTPSAARALLREHHRAPEADLLPGLVESCVRGVDFPAVRARAAGLVRELRQAAARDWLAGFLQTYGLDTSEGRALLTLAEACLRIPDARSASALIRDKLGRVDWRARTGASPSASVNATTYLLVLARAMMRDEGGLRRLIARTSEGFVLRATRAALTAMAGHFVLGEDIDAGLARAGREKLLCSFDMLGEGARTAADADRHFEAYLGAIEACGRAGTGVTGLPHAVSVKLSALHPRYEPLQARRTVPELADRLGMLVDRAADFGLGLTVDAEESWRLEMSLDIIESVVRKPRSDGREGLGLAVQAYQKRATGIIGWAESLGRDSRRHLAVRLVKGAYWDTEIKRCQEQGLTDYPVWQERSGTDVSYLACARLLLDSDRLRAAFATHNALTVATLLSWARSRRDIEFQRLHGMGAELHDRIADEEGIVCRVYAPIGGHRDLLAYLVRRLLENTANTGFIHQLGDPDVSDEMLLADPAELARQSLASGRKRIPLPPELFGPERRNSLGMDFGDRACLDGLAQALAVHAQERAVATPPGVTGHSVDQRPRTVWNPARHDDAVGTVIEATAADVRRAVDVAVQACRDWERTPVTERAACLRRLGGLIEAQRHHLMSLLIREAGKTRLDALQEVREAVDFCRYYAGEAERLLTEYPLPGPTGEDNRLRLHPRGVFACISPWNFPLAIFTGQVSAALVAGNAVIAKPAPQTPLTAAAAVRLAHDAGIPVDVLQLMPGDGMTGEALVADSRVQGVAFTGSFAAARRIASTLLADPARPLVPLIAETGGINAMIVDATALTEQVCDDVITSAFRSAGQRCSALRLLCVQDDIYDQTLLMLQGAMAELVVGDPADEPTDVGPLIDRGAVVRAETWLERFHHRVRCTAPRPVSSGGWYVPPTLIEIDHPRELDEEIFGPVLHVVRWPAAGLDELIDCLNDRGHGLTMGLHTRLDSVIDRVCTRARVGNLYVNRSMIGAVVGSQPFGGESLSGTGPKAGGPHYLIRFCTERSVSIDTSAAGGNADLLGGLV